MGKLNFWVPIQEPKWHTPVRPSIHLPSEHVTYFEWNVGNFGQAIAIPAVPLPTALLYFYTESEK